MSDPIGSNTGKAPYRSLGYQQIVNPTVATNLTPPPGASFALIAISGAPVRYRADGPSPDTATGMPRVAGQEFKYSGDLTAIQFIGPGATLDVDYYYDPQ